MVRPYGWTGEPLTYLNIPEFQRLTRELFKRLKKRFPQFSGISFDHNKANIQTKFGKYNISLIYRVAPPYLIEVKIDPPTNRSDLNGASFYLMRKGVFQNPKTIFNNIFSGLQAMIGERERIEFEYMKKQEELREVIRKQRR